MPPLKIAFFDAKPYDIEAFDAANAGNSAHGYAIKYYSAHLSEDTAPLAKGFDTVCLFVNDYVTPVVADLLHANGIRLIALRSAGYNNVDLASVFERIHVVHVPAYSPYAVAEHAVAMILTLNRKTHRAYTRTREGNFSLNGLTGFDMNGKTAGVIGYGKIGRIAARILAGFGMRVLVADPFAKALDPDEPYELAELDRLYAESDVITLHCPLTPQNVHLVGAESIAKMKPGVVLVNTGRGKLVDTKALIDGLKEGRIGAAGLDVYEEETEYFFEDHSSSIMRDDVLARLLAFPNVLVTSHQAFLTREALANIADTTLENIRLFFEKDELPNEICYRCGQDRAACVHKAKGKCF